MREVNHQIKLIDPDKRYYYRLPKCPEILCPQLHTKIDRYLKAGWWEPTTALQAILMLCAFKKDKEILCTVFDMWLQNANTERDVTPFPDMDLTRNNVARVNYRSKLDMFEAYEWICIVPEDVEKTTFSTIFSTFKVT